MFAHAEIGFAGFVRSKRLGRHPRPRVRSIAKRLLFAKSATAEEDAVTFVQNIAIRILDYSSALYFVRPFAPDGDGHFIFAHAVSSRVLSDRQVSVNRNPVRCGRRSANSRLLSESGAEITAAHRGSIC